MHRRQVVLQAGVDGHEARRDADAVGAEALHLGLREMDAVRAPHILCEPADALQIFDRRAAVDLPAVRRLLGGLGKVGVELEAEPPRERS